MPEIERDYNEQTENEKTTSLGKIIFCYLLAFILLAATIYGMTVPLARFLTWVADISGIERLKDSDITEIHVISFVAIVFLTYKLVRLIGDYWRSTGDPIGTSGLNFPNPFYDPEFTKGPLLLQRRYKEVSTKLLLTQKLLQRSQEHTRKLKETLKSMEDKLRVSIRHNDNSNRLLRSFNFLFKNKSDDLTNQMLRYILDECITVLEKDQSDKSISLFKVHDDELKIIESVRINAESIAKRTFKKGVGFAGYTWKEGKPSIVNVIDNSDKRFNDQGLPATPIGSILGFPLKVDDQILGVLCLQSEAMNGFSEADLRTVEFYARMCTLILQYDTIKGNKEGF